MWINNAEPILARELFSQMVNNLSPSRLREFLHAAAVVTVVWFKSPLSFLCSRVLIYSRSATGSFPQRSRYSPVFARSKLKMCRARVMLHIRVGVAFVRNRHKKDYNEIDLRPTNRCRHPPTKSLRISRAGDGQKGARHGSHPFGSLATQAAGA
jgi:hypothetical protein